MRGLSTALGLAAALAVASTGITSANASCARRIVNKSGYIALVSRDGGPWVAVRPGRSQTINYYQSGRIDVALTCGPGALPEQASFRASYDTVAIIDRCYIRFGDGFFEDQLGGGFLGRKETGPLALNNPRQGDLVVGPQAGACPATERAALSARY
ncbi:hypothetical protein H0176_03255 [Methylorubrum populi]|jgi:hypothetical protein|uniref:Uncharacterized protein n=1 Tax=Methylorubrum rhodesianum TaxID=29427 RepID=A0ABU9ZJP2_9HYPH|nr:hypothetical protein [Methylorubrum rhodesianum]MBK3405523.1 hypothetical protein [Methylorubrum rhodesianum]MBY0139289.1 hypothetical protein [Methylorubrum populi]